MPKPSQVLKTRGWCQGEIESSDGRVCLLGALMNSTLTPHQTERFNIALWQLLQMNAVRFNDEPGRTFEEILAVVEEAERLAGLDTSAPLC